jgi:DNA-binding transcriptional MerR regulator
LECIPEFIILIVQGTSSRNLRSGSLAKATGVSPGTIRHYEKIGVLPKAARTESGYRVYPESAVERVLVVQRALRIGFTLSELSEVLKARDTGGTPCSRVYEIAQKKLVGIKADIKALRGTEKYLTQVMADWKQKMRRAGPGQRSHLLHSLTSAIGNHALTNRFRRKSKS